MKKIIKNKIKYNKNKHKKKNKKLFPNYNI